MDTLPTDIYLEIFKHLDDVDLLKIPLLSTHFNNVMKNKYIWLHRIKQWVFNLEMDEKPITKQRYIEILRTWPRINSPKKRTVGDDADCLCNLHIYDDAEKLDCFDYIPIEALDWPDQIDMYIPLQFWFNQNPGLALPIIAIPPPIRIDFDQRFIDSPPDDEN
jgi:F-box domain/Major capsid protein N-terminus